MGVLTTEREREPVQLFQFRCSGCGYGASCRIAPDRCPLCGGTTWEVVLPERPRDPGSP